MLQNDAVWLVRRPGRVEDASDVVGLSETWRVVGALTSQSLRAEVQVNDFRDRARQIPDKPFLGEQYFCLRIFQDKALALLGTGRVQRQISATRFPNAEQPGNHLKVIAARNSDQSFRPDSQTPQT